MFDYESDKKLMAISNEALEFLKAAAVQYKARNWAQGDELMRKYKAKEEEYAKIFYEIREVYNKC